VRHHRQHAAGAGLNRTKSRIRARIEHVFGAQETAPGGRLVRTIGTIRARAKIGLQNLVYNIRRLATLERMEEKATGRRKRGRKPKEPDASVDPDRVANPTDPDSATRRRW
jgi:hypothetical protein